MDLTDVPTTAPIISETIVIKPENQKDITRENQNRNVRFLIPNYVGYFLPSQSNFSFSIKMEGRGNPIPSRDAGLHSLFNVVRTYDVTNSHLLEEVIQYNTLVAQKFQYTKTTSVDNYRAEFEGVQPNNSVDQNLYWKPTADSYAAGTVVAPDTAKSVQFSGTIKTDFYDSDKFIPCAVFNGLRTEIQMEDYRRALEFTTGSMGIGINNMVLPKDMNIFDSSPDIGAAGGDPALPAFDYTTPGNGYKVGFIYTASVGGQIVGFINVTAITGGGANGPISGAEWFCLSEGQTQPEAGQALTIGTPTAGTPAAATLTVSANANLLGGLRISNANDQYHIDLGSTSPALQITAHTSGDLGIFGTGSARDPIKAVNQQAPGKMGYDDTSCFPNVLMPFSVGDRLYIADTSKKAASKKSLGIITGIAKTPGAGDANKGARIFFLPEKALVGGVGNEVEASTLTGGASALDPGITQSYAFRNNLDGFGFFVEENERINVLFPTIANRTNAPTRDTLIEAGRNVVNFTISNLQYNIKRVDMDESVVSADLKAANSSSGYRLDLATTQTRLVNLQAIQGPTSQLISIPNITKALAVLSVPLNQNEQLSVAAQSLRGQPDNLTNYQYDIGRDGLQPQRKVLVEKASLADPLIQTQHINELIKAVEGFDMELSSLNGVLMNFAVGRQFARNDMFYNLMEAGDLTLKAEYDTVQTFPKLVVHFIHHIRSILVTSGGIQVAN